MNEKELALAPAVKLRELIQSKEISPIEITQIYLDRIDKLDTQLHSYITVTADSALESAKIAEEKLMKGDQVGPLHGLPISIKDTQMTKGIKTTSGTAIYKDRIAETDATIVEKVKTAGAIILGKTNTPELGLVGTCINKLGEQGRNPWDITRTPGGSSGGAAAAVAAGLCAMATGSDGGGSIRIPSNFCGIFGIKPTQGRVSAYNGSMSKSHNMFSQNGPLTRTVEDSVLLLETLAGTDVKDPITYTVPPIDFETILNENIQELKVAWSPDYGFASVESEILEINYQAVLHLERLGCKVENPPLNLYPPYDKYGAIITSDFFNSYGQYLDSHGDDMTDFCKFFIDKGSQVTTKEYSETLGHIDELKGKMAQFFMKYDLLVSPTACFEPFTDISFEDDFNSCSKFPLHYFNGAFTMQANLIGYPAASIPIGFTSNGLPVGFHVIAPKGEEGRILSLALKFQETKPWAKSYLSNEITH